VAAAAAVLAVRAVVASMTEGVVEKSIEEPWKEPFWLP